jgi:hypothetical protein
LAQRADARLPGRNPRRQVFIRNEADKLMVRIAAALKRRYRSSRRRNFEEITPLHEIGSCLSSHPASKKMSLGQIVAHRRSADGGRKKKDRPFT